jgi:autotransporter-associated beta strand protein/T5SS/PEP-CTERM-associated repeat protein
MMKKAIAIVMGMLLAAGAAHAGTDGTWIYEAMSDGSWNWTDASKWQDGVIADGAGATATIAGHIGSSVLYGMPQINLNDSRTIGHLVFDPVPEARGRWVISIQGANVLTLSDPVATPTIQTPYDGMIGGTIGGSQGFIKSGGKVLMLGGNSTYTGITDITEGTMNIWSNNVLGAVGAGNHTIVRSGATLALANNVSTPESLIIRGYGTGMNTGAVSLGDHSVLEGDITLDSGARIRQASGTGTISGDINLGSHSLALEVKGYGPDLPLTLDIAGNITGSGSLWIHGSSVDTVNLTGDNSGFSGNGGLQGATLNTNLMAVGATDAATFSNYYGNHTLSDSLYVGTYSSGTGTYEMEGTGSKLTAPNVYLGNQGVGTLEQAAGTGSVTNDMYLGLLSGGRGIYNLSDGTMTIDNDLYLGGSATAAGGTGTVNISGGHLTVHGAVKIWGGGELNLIGGFLTTPSTTFAGGTLGGDGTIYGDVIAGAGTLVAPGNSPGLLTIDGDYTQDALARLEIELGGLTRGSEYDALIVTGAMNPGGTLNVSLWNGFDPVGGNSFDILDWGSLSGRFACVDLPALGAGLYWDASGLYATGTLSVHADAQLIPGPGAIVLSSIGMGLIGWLRRRRSL